MTKSPRKNVADVGIKLRAACMPSGHASDRATAPGSITKGVCMCLCGGGVCVCGGGGPIFCKNYFVSYTKYAVFPFFCKSYAIYKNSVVS